MSWLIPVLAIHGVGGLICDWMACSIVCTVVDMISIFAVYSMRAGVIADDSYGAAV